MTERRTGARVLLAATVLVMAWLGVRAVTAAMADHYALRDPARALSWRSDHPEALFRQAERLAADPAQADAAAGFARRALQANPLDGRAYRVLATLALQRNDQAEAARLFVIAAQRAPRDALSQAWLLDYHLQRGDLPAALRHLDLMLRVQPGQFAPLEPLLLSLVTRPEAHAALAEKLAGAPPWRGQLLALASQKAPSADDVAPLFDRLRKSPGGLGPQELAGWIDRLGRDDRWPQAYLVWVNQLPPERLARLGNVFNGGFEWEPGQGGFDWRFDRMVGARVDRLPTDGAEGRLALRVAYEDRRVPFAHVRQRLALPPGPYRLSGQARPDGLRTERGLVWTLTCASGGAPLGETEPLRGGSTWRPFEADFVVPAHGCGGQWLTLRLPARIPAEQRIGGRAWFDALKITRQRAAEK